MTTFTKLVAEAVQNEITLRQLTGQSGALSCKGYLAACAVAPASKSEADKIEEALASDPASPLQSSIRRMCKAIRDFARTAPIQKLGGYIGDDVDGALLDMGVTRASLFLVAARRVTKSHPELFGTLNSLADLNAAVAKCKAERERLFAEIERAFDASDLIWDATGVVKFKGTNVALHTDFAEALVNHAIGGRMAAAA
jgi:hypothetical protein